MRVGGWVCLDEWLHTKVVCSPVDGATTNWDQRRVTSMILPTPLLLRLTTSEQNVHVEDASWHKWISDGWKTLTKKTDERTLSWLTFAVVCICKWCNWCHVPRSLTLQSIILCNEISSSATSHLVTQSTRHRSTRHTRVSSQASTQQSHQSQNFLSARQSGTAPR